MAKQHSMNLFNRLLIWQKFTLGFVIIGFFFFGIVSIYHLSLQQIGRSYEHLISEDFARFTLGNQLSHTLAMMRDVEYNFRITPNETLAEDHENYFKEFLGKLTEFTKLEEIAGDADLKAPKGILEQIHVYRKAFVATVDLWKSKGTDSRSSLQVQFAGDAGKFKQTISEMEEANQEIEFLVEYHFKQVIQDMKKSSESTQEFSRERTKLAFIMASILIILMIGIAFLLVNSLVHPISKVTSAMLYVADGNMDSQVPVVGNDELGQMATIFNQMAYQLRIAHTGLQNEQDKLMTILLSAREGIIGTNREGVVVLVNPAALRLLGKTEEQIVTGGFLNLLDDPDYVGQFLEKSGFDMPETVVYNEKVLNFFAASIRDRTGEIVGSAALLRDVTEEKNLERMLRNLSNTDGLTQLINRRYFDELMLAEYQRARRYNLHLGLLLFDVDHFKKFNDTYGHDQGDRVLQAIAKTMKASFRDTDYCCRYGGEEFCVITPNTSIPGLMVAAERLRTRVEAMVVDGLKVTISIGATAYPIYLPEAQGPAEIFKAADNALYEAKRSGRNRVCVSNLTGTEAVSA